MMNQEERIYHRVVKNPPVYLINLPFSTDKVYLSLYYKAGYIFSDDFRDLSHLFEHFVISSLIHQGIPENSVQGSVDAEVIEFSFRIKREKLLRSLEIIKSVFSHLDVMNKKIFDLEKRIVCNEIGHKSNNPDLYRSYLISTSIFSPDCAYRRSLDFFELDKFRYVTIRDLRKFYYLHIKKNPPVICFGGYKVSSSEVKQLKRFALNFKISSLKPVLFPRCKIKTKITQEIYDPTLKNGMYLSFIFPIPFVKQTDIVYRRAVILLLRSIYSSNNKESINTYLRKNGITPSILEVYLYKRLGYFVILIYGDYNQELRIGKALRRYLDHLYDSKVITSLVSKGIQRAYPVGGLNINNEMTFYTFSDVLALDEKPLSLKQLRKELLSLKARFWQKLVGGLIDRRNLSIVIFKSSKRSTQIEKLQEVLSKK